MEYIAKTDVEKELALSSEHVKSADKGHTRIGAAEGAFTCCDDFDFCNDEVSRLFEESEISA